MLSFLDRRLDPHLDWDSLLVKALPRRFLLAAVLLAVGIGVDLPWLDSGATEVLLLRGGMVGGAIAIAWLGRYCRTRASAEVLVVVGVLSVVMGMAVISWIESTFVAYTAGLYQVLIFVVIFLPLRIWVYAGLLGAAGVLWFVVAPTIFSLQVDPRHFTSNLIGYLTYCLMLVAGNRLFLKLRAEEEAKRLILETSAGHLRELAIRDDLTGVYNFRHFQELLPLLVAEAGKCEQPLSLCLLDLDEFKMFNDKGGHTVGNAVLEQVGRCLSGTVRQGDHVFRIGGDEFAVVLRGTSGRDAVVVVERIQAALVSLELSEQGPSLRGLPLVTCSIGIAELSPQWSTSEELLQAADKALYRAKGEKSSAGGRIMMASAT